MSYRTPVRDFRFALKHMASFDSLAATGAFDDVSDDLVEAILEEMARYADEVVAPLNRIGDTVGAVRNDDGTLAGSALSLDRAVRNLVAFTGGPAADAIASATSTPAMALGLDHEPLSRLEEVDVGPGARPRQRHPALAVGGPHQGRVQVDGRGLGQRDRCEHRNHNTPDRPDFDSAA